MKEPLLLNELLKYNDEKNLILSMPGNKCGIGFEKDEIGKEFLKRMGNLDITEVDPLDNLHCPNGVIKEAQELLAKTYKSNKAYFLVNGSSSGNLTAIFSEFNEGDEVIVERNCHKSIYNGLILRKLKVTYIEAVIDKRNGIFLPVNKENIYSALNKCKNPKGIILTYPNYFGITYDIEEIIIDLKRKGITSIIDCAHGAHFGFNDRLPKSITSFGDYVVLSAHKTLPALTQGAYLLVNKENKELEFYLKSFMTTSPSYLIMASLDYARYYLDKYAQKEYEKLIDRAEVWKNEINNLKKVVILSKDDLSFKGYEMDLSRYLMILPEGYNGNKLLTYLRKYNIQAEMSFSRGVVLILSPFNTDEHFELLYNAVIKLDMDILKGKIEECYDLSIPEKVLEPYEVFNMESEYLDFRQCEGKIAKEAIIPYPPGIPIVCPGEKVTREAIYVIKDYIDNDKDILGIYNKKINIIR
ncbi:MAG: aminotransferase class I/II-fold pyridoxal phosphate-dependent enzyme [Clostridium butyricum]|nr:aminotransferase class I/II-fold pyridoxal phosphate-dependent enzyme [Clostridium butyricum]